jgi:hypothetical protein
MMRTCPRNGFGTQVGGNRYGGRVSVNVFASPYGFWQDYSGIQQLRKCQDGQLLIWLM